MPFPHTHFQSLLEGGNVPSHAEPDSSSSVAVLSFSCYFGEQNTFFRPTDVEEFVEGSHLDFSAGFSSQSTGHIVFKIRMILCTYLIVMWHSVTLNHMLMYFAQVFSLEAKLLLILLILL